MQEQLEEQVHVGCKDIENMQIMMKGKRTKRQRLPSPLRLNMSSISSSSTENSGLIASSIDEFRKRSILSDQEEENDMANCLILLAQGHHHHHHTQKASHHNNNNLGLYLNYQCKTCNRCFPSFQALGGHRASHKKPKVANTTDQEKQLASAVTTTTTTTTFVGDHDHDHDQYPTNTTLTLQLYSTNNRALYTNNSTTTTTTSTIKSKVHECSICGAEFTSGQALGGHMRRHRSRTSLMMSTSTATTTMSTDHGVVVNGHGGSPETQQAKAPRNALKLDLNLPAPEDDNNSREPKFPFQPKDKVIVFSATSLVDCHY